MTPDKTPEEPSAARMEMRIRTRMRELKLSQRGAAMKAGLGEDYVRDILRGRIREPSFVKLQALAKALDVSPAWLLGGTAERDADKVIQLPRMMHAPPKPPRQRGGLFDLVERVAKAIHEERGKSVGPMPLWEEAEERLRETARALAKAAIREML